MDCDNKDIEDIQNMLSSEGFHLDDGDSLSLECDSSEHTENNRIREGNDAYVIIKIEDDWDIEEVVCSDCSVRGQLDKHTTDGDASVAVIEARTMYDIPDDMVQFSKPKVWEYVE